MQKRVRVTMTFDVRPLDLDSVIEDISGAVAGRTSGDLRLKTRRYTPLEELMLEDPTIERLMRGGIYSVESLRGHLPSEVLVAGGSYQILREVIRALAYRSWTLRGTVITVDSQIELLDLGRRPYVSLRKAGIESVLQLVPLDLRGLETLVGTAAREVEKAMAVAGYSIAPISTSRAIGELRLTKGLSSALRKAGLLHVTVAQLRQPDNLHRLTAFKLKDRVADVLANYGFDLGEQPG